MQHQFAVIDSELEYKKDLDGNVRTFTTMMEAILHFTVGTIGYVQDKDDETVLQYRGNPFNKLKIIPYVYLDT